MRKSLLFALPAIASLAAVSGSVPAFATNARTAIGLCDQRPGCTYEVADDGFVFIHVDGHLIICPPGMNCVLVYRSATADDFRVHPGALTTQPDANGSGHATVLGTAGGSHFGTTGGDGGSTGGGSSGGFIGGTGVATNAGLSSDPTKGKGIQPLH